MKAMLESWLTEFARGRPYHPQSQGQRERDNFTVVDRLMQYLQSHPDTNWVEATSKIGFSMNHSERSNTTGVKPYVAVFGKHHHLRVDAQGRFIAPSVPATGLAVPTPLPEIPFDVRWSPVPEQYLLTLNLSSDDVQTLPKPLLRFPCPVTASKTSAFERLLATVTALFAADVQVMGGKRVRLWPSERFISNIPEILRESFRLDSEAVADGMSSAANVGLELIQLWGDTNALRNVAPEAALSYAGKVLSEHRALLLHVSPEWRVRSFFPESCVSLG